MSLCSSLWTSNSTTSKFCSENNKQTNTCCELAETTSVLLWPDDRRVYSIAQNRTAPPSDATLHKEDMWQFDGTNFNIWNAERSIRCLGFFLFYSPFNQPWNGLTENITILDIGLSALLLFLCEELVKPTWSTQRERSALNQMKSVKLTPEKCCNPKDRFHTLLSALLTY